MNANRSACYTPNNIPKGSKHPIFKISGPRYHFQKGFWSQQPQILGTWSPVVSRDIFHCPSRLHHPQEDTLTHTAPPPPRPPPPQTKEREGERGKHRERERERERPCRPETSDPTPEANPASEQAGFEEGCEVEIEFARVQLHDMRIAEWALNKNSRRARPSFSLFRWGLK